MAMHEVAVQVDVEGLLKPDYWDGYDVFDNSFVGDADDTPPGRRLGAAEYRQSQRLLQAEVGKVVGASVVQCSHIPQGSIYDNALGDGQLVTLEYEALGAMANPTPITSQADIFTSVHYPGPHEPHGGYWLEMQTERPSMDIGLLKIGLNRQIAYTRSLHWGVQYTSGDERVIQPFAFSRVTARAGRFGRKIIDVSNADNPEDALSLPINVGALTREVVKIDGKPPCAAIWRLVSMQTVDVSGSSNTQDKPPKRPRGGRKVGKIRNALPVIRPVLPHNI